MSALVPFALGWLFGRSQGGFHLFGSSYTPVSNRGGGLPAHRAHPAPIVHDVPQGLPMATSTAVHWTSSAPAGLPPFPSGWKPAQTTPAVVQRAWSLMGTLPVGETKYEHNGSSGWIAFHASSESGKKYVTAWEPKGTVVPAAPVGIPVVSPAVQQSAAHPHPVLRRGSPERDAVREWQRRLHLDDDGQFGQRTEDATRAFQRHHGLDPDGVVGPLTWAASETASA